MVMLKNGTSATPLWPALGNNCGRGSGSTNGSSWSALMVRVFAEEPASSAIE
jgi:hypothetical protein